MEKVTLIFKDGTRIEAERNGSCFITDRRPDFPADLSEITVAGEGETKYRHAEVIACASVDGRYWFGFREISEAEREARQMQANLEYLAMMTDVDLEEA